MSTEIGSTYTGVVPTIPVSQMIASSFLVTAADINTPFVFGILILAGLCCPVLHSHIPAIEFDFPLTKIPFSHATLGLAWM